MARNGSLQYSGGYCSDVSHYRDAILLRARSLAWSLPSPSQPSRGQKKEKKKKKNIRMERAVEIQDRRITNACRPSFVAGALTANSKLR